MSEKKWSNLARIVTRRTYNRNDNGVHETWSDTVHRAVAGNVRGRKVSEQETNRLIELALARKSGFAGRGWWFSGTKAHERLGGSALCNCWTLTANLWENFVIAQDLLMLGGGVGMSVEHKFTSKLPKVKKDVTIVHQATKDADFIVPDSRTGWNELTRRLLEAFFVTGKSFSYSTICVRGYGEPIHGFGGTASGPIPLLMFVETMCKILQARAGKHMRPIDAADLLTATGQLVVSGNVRRSAILLQGDCWDKDFLRAKRWDLGDLPPHRAYANYSVVCSDVDDLHPLFWKTYEQGEPFGIINIENIQKYGRLGELKSDAAVGVNPCQPEWATVLTPEGIRQFRDIGVGSTIWSGSRWTKVVKKWSTGEKPVFGFGTRAGIFYGTEMHRVVSNGQKVEAKFAESIDICPGEYTKVYDIDPQAVMDGLVIGDGSVHKASGNLVCLVIGSKDSDYHDSEVKPLIKRFRPGISPCWWEVQTTVTHHELPKTFLREVPERFKQGDARTVRSFLRGLFSANGSVVGGRVTLKAASFKIIEDVQQMLSAVGIRSYYTVNKGKAIEFKNGRYLCKESYDINISVDVQKFADTIGFLQQYKNEVLKEVIAKKPAGRTHAGKSSFDVMEVFSLGVQEVFDITVDDPEHTYWTGGLLVSNCAEATLEQGEPCNLVELALPNMDNEDEFVESSRLWYRAAKRVTLEKYHHAVSDEVIKRNRRVGVGITGCLASPLFNPKSLDRTYQAIQKEDEVYSKELGVPRSIRTTVIKPSGTMSKVFDCDGYEGIHPAYSRYIIQRVRFAAGDALIPKLRAAGHHIEPVVGFNGVDPSTLVVDFYVQAPDGYPVADEDWDTWKQLDAVLMAQKHWADQSVSCTVYYQKQDIPKLKAWLADNLKSLKTISFLCHDDHGFKQAPKEKITKEQFEKLSSGIKELSEADINDGSLESMECSSGVCPVK